MIQDNEGRIYKSMDTQELRMLLMARAQLVSQRQAVANNIRGLLKTFGFVIARGSEVDPSRWTVWQLG